MSKIIKTLVAFTNLMLLIKTQENPSQEGGKAEKVETKLNELSSLILPTSMTSNIKSYSTKMVSSRRNKSRKR